MRFIHPVQNTPDQDAAYVPLNEALGWLRGVCERRGVPAIRRETEPLLAEILQEEQSQRILEIGTAIGYSACFMATVLPAARITTIEILDRSYYDAKEAIERLGYTDRIEQILGDAKDVLPQLVREGRRYDLTFIDAAKSHYGMYYEQALTMMGKGGLILCDNLSLGASLSHPGEGDRRHRTSAKRMERFLADLADDPRTQTTFYETGDGFSVSRILTD